jgi:hypothetical protein
MGKDGRRCPLARANRTVYVGIKQVWCSDDFNMALNSELIPKTLCLGHRNNTRGAPIRKDISNVRY